MPPLESLRVRSLGMAQAKAPARSLRVARLGIVQGSDQGGGWDHDLI